ncbi:2-polyprenyl-3-methyl-6-methoxy-1,4-benzoquinone monooxygenase [Herbaspirillum sp. RTI4]|uniref:2-polyprenyl-3-methyl-6-methoxy-1,4-benzoquinone monooxygenase n=1 Tax=Herbaspirillum sp. RTI4 TaxID=3048640 RepID=UPI002AB52F82|nr:2-polyprenyl-3-methyl-6-methoxy-1,4-benzoquinone monooxygenase [Herbaspirillum sp. RTI4]MDY7577939.1 2-polyprenyl-3-methyl-6-methoxy-1,4-benzoquinone monooxygenase [Herbaspirillum sp. RTI4]MEA9981615.1 2-polyprenyl-3-methyl-6-methoxy-1,4-benzoquinone monooxygenase [Herbaspirillum sp. RTI4]
MGLFDKLIVDMDKALRVMSGVAAASRANPAGPVPDGVLSETEKRHSAGLMRINHVGEVCAQALYDAQGRFSHNPALRAQFAHASVEEEDHLAWTAQRLRELGSRISLLNPIWYAGSYLLGYAAAKAGDARNLGFVVETERQVAAHLDSHLQALPEADVRSRAIVEQMRLDEIEHGAAAQALGAAPVPALVRNVMQGMSKVMTTLAYRL